jgi:hypothetical protein
MLIICDAFFGVRRFDDFQAGWPSPATSEVVHLVIRG